MDEKIRLAQLYELQRVALINVHYYAARISRATWVNRWFQLIAALAASGTIAAVVNNAPPEYKWIRGLSILGSLIAAISASIVIVFNFTDSIARLERMHAAYKMLYHSAETLAKRTIGMQRLTPEQEAVLEALEMQLAALGPLDEINPDKDAMKVAQACAEQQLPDSYYYPKSA
jgi:hypothetical protein